MNKPFGGISDALAAAASQTRSESFAKATTRSYKGTTNKGSRALRSKKNAESAESLRRELIRQITDNQLVAIGKLAEAQSYAPARALLIDPRLGLGIPVDNVVVDAPVPFGRERPDVQIWLEGVPVSMRNEGEHLYAILELKSGSKVKNNGRAIAKDELATYAYRKLRHLYLADAEVVQRYDLNGVDLPVARQIRWIDLAPDDAFTDFFAPLGPVPRTLRAQLNAFASVDIPAGSMIGDISDRKRFVDAIVITARLLFSAVADLVARRLIPDLAAARAAIGAMEQEFGDATIDFTREEPITFANEPVATDRDAHAAFDERYTRFISSIHDVSYALRAETEDLPAYAERSGLKREHATFMPTSTGKEARATSQSARTSYIQETATLLFSRLMMIRFSEDHGLLPRMLSNGGLPRFAAFAASTGGRFQTLVTLAYERARPIYRHLFEEQPVDWLLHGEDETLSETLLHVMWILSGWDFTTVHGDLMSGIYDRNLDAAQRRALGEVYTRPELAAYMLQACGYDGTQSLLDPACGSGTFLVEAFETMRRRKIAAGLDVTTDDVVETLSGLHGMDMNGFSATLAQIQLLWHALLSTSVDPVDTMRRSITALEVEGGHSSLETWGTSMTATDLFEGGAGSGSEVARAAARAATRRLRNADRRFRDLASRREAYDIVAGNPPYVRVHRLRLTNAQLVEYQSIRRKQTDLSVLFTYRALEWWLAPGGMLGFYLPIALSESAYAEPLRAIIARYRIVEIIDLEDIGNVAFHGANVVTMGLIVQKSPSSPDDMVRITRVTPDCYTATKTIDMAKAVSELVPITAIQLGRYLPGGHASAGAVHTGAVSADEEAEQKVATATGPEDDEQEEDGGQEASSSDTAWLTKIRPTDVPLLDRLAAARRLDDLILRGWKSIGNGPKRFVAEIPVGEPAYRWKQARVMGYGVKIGGTLPSVAGGDPVYKAKSLPPDGQLEIEPAGRWDGSPSLVDTVRFYAWKDVGVRSNTFAIRNIATQAVFAPHPQSAYLTNTVYILRLRERFPLNIWSISKVVAWFMALTARTSVVQGYFTTFYPRQTTRMPIPAAITSGLIDELETVGARIFSADDELARGDRDLDQLRNGKGGKPLRKRLDLLEADTVSKPTEVAWPAADADWIGVEAEEQDGAIVFVAKDEDDQTVPAPTPSGEPCRIVVTDADLLAWMVAESERRLLEGDLPDRGWMQSMAIPDDLPAALAILARWRDATAARELDDAVSDLDAIVAAELGLTDDQLAHIHSAFEHDDLLRHTRPHWRHRRADRSR